MLHTKRPSRLIAALTLATVALLPSLTACSADSPEPEATKNAGGEVADVVFDGPEADMPTEIPAPKKVSGKTFKLGYLQIYSGLEYLVETQDAMKAATEELGGEFILKDADLNAQNQVSQFDELLSQKVDVIVVFPLDPAALAPQLAEAKAAGIPVIAQNATVSADDPLPADYLSTINEVLDTAAYSAVKNAAEQHPGGEFVMMGTSLPIPTVQYSIERTKYWAEQFGLKNVDQIDNQADNTGGFSQAASTLVSKHPDAKIVFAYSDAYALTVAQVVRSSGNADAQIYSTIGGTEVGYAAVESGALAGLYRMPWDAIGEYSVYAAYMAITDQKADIPPVVYPVGHLVTAENVAEFQG